MKRTILLLTVLLLGTQSFAQDISASYSNSKFEEQFHVDQLQSIEMWEQPKTQYTPKNLRTEQQMRFNGKEGTRTYNSYTLHMTDYDTYITDSYFKDGKFYIKDNTGKSFQTGELQQIDTSGIETSIQNNTTKIEKNTKAIQQVDTKVNNNTKLIKANTNRINKVDAQVQSNTQNINALKNGVGRLNTRVDELQSQINRLDNKLEQGLATVTALTGLHPNPRHQGKTQISVAAGMYADNVAGAVGVFHYLNDKVMLSAGASYGGDSSFAGNLGITIGF
jgi:archaellum component FlaC